MKINTENTADLKTFCEREVELGIDFETFVSSLKSDAPAAPLHDTSLPSESKTPQSHERLW